MNDIVWYVELWHTQTKMKKRRTTKDGKEEASKVGEKRGEMKRDEECSLERKGCWFSGAKERSLAFVLSSICLLDFASSLKRAREIRSQESMKWQKHNNDHYSILFYPRLVASALQQRSRKVRLLLPLPCTVLCVDHHYQDAVVRTSFFLSVCLCTMQINHSHAVLAHMVFLSSHSVALFYKLC